MASTEEPRSEPTKIVSESEPESKPAAMIKLFRAELVLRLLLFATTLVAVVVMVTSRETKFFPMALFPLVLDAKFNYSPALIYLVVANSTACLYSVVTAISSALFISRLSPPTKLLFHLLLLDALMLGVVASATGAGASIAYIGLRGNSHVPWFKVCDRFGKFCRYAGSSIIVSLIASIILVLLVFSSAYSLYHRSR